VNPVIRVLIVVDFLYWGAVNFIGPIFGIFVADSLTDGSIEAAGIAATLFLLSRSLAEIPVGMIIDRIKGERDDVYSVALGNAMFGIVFAFYPFMTTVGEMYIGQILTGIAAAISAPGWYTIFTRHIDKNKEGFEWSFYDVLTSIGMALSATIGGVIATRFGFDIVFWIVAAVSIFAGLTPLLIVKKVDQK
jgi:MFS family permease